MNDLYEKIDEKDFIQSSVEKAYGHIPAHIHFKFFQIEDIEDLPFFKVIVESVMIVKE